MIIDVHTHAFPDRLAPSAMGKLTKTFADIPCADGTLSCMRQRFDDWGIDCSVVLNIATNPHQQTNVNNFAIENNSPAFIHFGSVHPQSENALEELERIHRAGLLGIKLHPDYQNFRVEDSALFPIYQKCAELGLIVHFHAGFDYVNPDNSMGTPTGFAAVLDTFPTLKVVLAHMGSLKMADEVERHLVGRNVYFDTAMSATFLDPAQAKRMIQNHGYEKILFGSDMPWEASCRTLAYIRNLGLPADVEDCILYQNAARLLHLL